MNDLLFITVLDTVAEPSPEEMCEPLLWYWNSSPRYRMEVISQEFLLTVTLNGLSEPASTTMLFPEVEMPNAASAEEEKAKAANQALWRNMIDNLSAEICCKSRENRTPSRL